MFFDRTRAKTPPTRGWRRYTYGVIGREVSRLSRYCAQVVQARQLSHDDGSLLAAVDCEAKSASEGDPPDLTAVDGATLVLLNGSLNHCTDIEALLADLKPRLKRSDRLAIVAYNPYLRWMYVAGARLGLRAGEPPQTFVTRTDLNNLAKLAGYEVTRSRPSVFVPMKLGGLGDALNRLLPAVPGLRNLALTNVLVLRPVIPDSHVPSLSIVIPARNERGNIEPALQRLAAWQGVELEILFVEGNSTDGTWEEIQRVMPLYADRFPIRALQQTGTGKADAVRLGFAEATGELLTILDADLTMPPELLHRFHDAYRRGLADFINGSRLVYPMQDDAMRFLNRLGNTFFAKAVSSVLGVEVGDTLCGTKLLRREDYARILAWRRDFGDFDPFGDFELLFPAASLALGIVDVPVEYQARAYGSTNIARFTNGLELLRMTLVGWLKIGADLGR